MTASESSDPDRTRADIERTRADLADTVQALAAKTDVKARGRDSARQIKGRVRHQLTDAAQAMRGTSATVLRTARQRADSTGLTRAARGLQQRGNALGQRAMRNTGKFRSSGEAAATQAGPAAVRSIRHVTARVRSAARRRPAALVIAAMTGIGVALAARQLQPGRRARRRP
ncbi:DUF3618 domain-containing protein [Micromonospora sp. 4G55]|uniref:DUF3618 domain-containing protein n=1 Tax=Micromonospora sp. 4G55 TaxID=2806102 RepID=UPI001A36C238|nr:DUF3618 domain-containing protein [Micromonospora sp. 4G55]MBM0255639.1 DUF3618 domain-containing protein [Micromonospora sp. 4G55]